MFYVNLYCILACILLFYYAFKSNEPFNFEDKRFNIFLFIIITIALFARIYQFGSVPAGVNQDEAMAAVDALSLSKYGTDRFGMRLPVHFTAWGYGQMSVLLSYLMVSFIKLFGFNVIAIRLPMLIISLLGLFCVYKLSKECFNKSAALIILAFAAISPWHIMQSRWAIDCNLLPHFFLFGMYFFKVKKYCIGALFFGLCMYSYGIALYSVPVFLIIMAVYLLMKKEISVKKLVASALIYIAVSMPFFLVIFINFFKLPTISTPFFTIPFFPDSLRSNDILFFSDNLFKQLMINFKAAFHIIIFQNDSLPWNVIANIGTIYYCSIVFVIAGLYFMLKQKQGAFIIYAALATALISGLITNSVNINRFNLVFYPLMLLAGYGVYSLIKKLKHTSLFIALIYTFLLICFMVSYFGVQKETLGTHFFDSFGEAISTTEKFDKVYISPNIQSKNTPYVSEILVLFYEKIDAKKFNSPSYKNKYIYELNSFDDKAVHIIKNDEIYSFDESKYNIKRFENYSVLIGLDLLK